MLAEAQHVSIITGYQRDVIGGGGDNIDESFLRGHAVEVDARRRASSWVDKFVFLLSVVGGSEGRFARRARAKARSEVGFALNFLDRAGGTQTNRRGLVAAHYVRLHRIGTKFSASGMKWPDAATHGPRRRLGVGSNAWVGQT